MKYDDPEQKVHSLIQHEIQLENPKTPNMNILLISKSEKPCLTSFPVRFFFFFFFFFFFCWHHVTYITTLKTAYTLPYSVYYTS